LQPTFPDRATYSHVVNGTQSLVYTQAASSQTPDKRVVVTFDNDAFNLGREIASFKLSYIHPCNTGDISRSTSVPFAYPLDILLPPL